MTTTNAIVYPLRPRTPVTPESENQKKAAAASSSSTATASAPGARARANMERLFEYYCETFDRGHCAPSIQRDIFEALKAGMTAKTITLCMDAAAAAERPTWAYASAVMRRCISEGALTPEAFAERAARQRSGKGRSGEGRFASDRTYSEEELNSLTSQLFDMT